MKIKTSELKGTALDWAVAKCEGLSPKHDQEAFGRVWYGWWVSNPEFEELANYSTSWNEGGPIIDRELIATDYDHDVWNAAKYGLDWYCGGTTPLEAAMRCYCQSKLGDEIEIPEELL